MNKYLFVPVKFTGSEVFCVICHHSINKVFGLEIAEVVRFPVERLVSFFPRSLERSIRILRLRLRRD